MSYQVLARKYRPQTFEEVVGQQPITTTLQNAVSQKRVHHAYLFSGLRGVGKTTVARLVAKALNCAEGPAAVPCNRCASCEEIAQSRSLDVMEIDGASNRGIDDVRELRETVRYAPARDRYKVYIIDEVHMLTEPAWNALLKTLEEPPAHVVFVFATTDYRKIPLTILSRCQHFEFRKIAHAEILAHLEKVARGEKAEVHPAALDLVARMAQGSLRDAQSALDQVIAFCGSSVSEEQARTILGVIDRELVSGFYDAVRQHDCPRLVDIIDTVFERGYQPVPFLEDLMAYGRDLLLARVLPEPGRHIAGGPEEVRALAGAAAAFSEDSLLRLLELLTREEMRLRNSAHPRFLLEALAIKLARLADLEPIDEILARLEGPGTSGDTTPPRRSSPARDASPAARPARREAAPAASPASHAEPPREQAAVEALLRRVHDERGALGGFLEQAAWVDLSDGTLTIAFHEKHAFFREKMESREAVAYLQKVGRDVTGSDVEVRISTAAPAVIDVGAVTGPAPAAESEDDRRTRLREAALREPVVRSLLQAFGGEIVDVDGV